MAKKHDHLSGRYLYRLAALRSASTAGCGLHGSIRAILTRLMVEGNADTLGTAFLTMRLVVTT